MYRLARTPFVLALALVAVTAAWASSLWACSPPGANKPTGTLRVLERDRAEGGRARCLIAFLPGIGDEPEAYLEHGFVDRLHAANVDADVRLVDAHFGYYREQSVVPRLVEDVLEPAETAGYDQLWLVGISLGGLGSLALSSAEPVRVDGLILLAPYLGDVDQVATVEGAGWPEQVDVPAEEPFDRIWRWLATRDTEATPLVLAYGEADRFRDGHRLASRAVPPSDVLVGAGGHRWPVWEELWGAIVDSGRLQRACSAPTEREPEEQTGDE
ncbi:MAG: alpha/beta hydrolase [Deltaproteobacteria bacterium]|nr:alpha/beta hydrolase [Deltaproteobacteria bacterium]